MMLSPYQRDSYKRRGSTLSFSSEMSCASGNPFEEPAPPPRRPEIAPAPPPAPVAQPPPPVIIYRQEAAAPVAPAAAPVTPPWVDDARRLALFRSMLWDVTVAVLVLMLVAKVLFFGRLL